MNVPTNATASAIPSINATESGPNDRSTSSNDNCLDKLAFRIITIAISAAKAIKNDNNAINNDSAKKILNTSLPLAPTALNTPISCVLDEIDTVIKLNHNNAENNANAKPEK